MPGPSEIPSGEALFLAGLPTIERAIAYVCRRNHLSSIESDDFASHVKLKLIESNYGILTKFKGRSSLQTYLAVVIQRLFLDYRIAAWGKWRPSAEAKRAGAIGILLEQLTARDGLSFDEACQSLTTNHGVNAPRAQLERLAAALPKRPRRKFEPEDVLDSHPSPVRPLESMADDRQHQALADRVSAVVGGHLGGLDPEDRLVLTMRFEDGRTVADIAVILRLDQKALYRRVERLLSGLRRAMEEAGIEARAVFEMLDSPAVVIDWRGDADKISAPRPSVTEGAREWR